MDLRYFNPFMGRFIMVSEDCFVKHEMDLRIPVGHSVVWDFSDVSDTFVGSSADLRQLPATIDCFGPVVDAEAEELGGDDESVVEVSVEPRELTEAQRVELLRGYLRCVVVEVPDSV